MRICEKMCLCSIYFTWPASHYLNQYWQRCLTPYGVIHHNELIEQCLKINFSLLVAQNISLFNQSIKILFAFWANFIDPAQFLVARGNWSTISLKHWWGLVTPWCHRTWSILDHVMACDLFITMPIAEPMLIFLMKQTTTKFELNFSEKMSKSFCSGLRLSDVYMRQ